MDDERFDRDLREEAQHYHRPPEVPRERIWMRIAERRQAERARAARRGRWVSTLRRAWSASVAPLRMRSVAVATAAAAAILVIGIWIGRSGDQSVVGSIADHRSDAAAATAGPSSDASRAAEDARRQALLRAAAGPYFGRIETLLTALDRMPEASKPSDRVVAWAGDLLAETRLLIDAPGAEDEKLRALLEDLELILTQIVKLTERSADGDPTRVRRSIERKVLLPRVQRHIESDFDGART